MGKLLIDASLDSVNMLSTNILFILMGVFVGVFASFTGLGGGLIMVPMIMFMGNTAQKAVGTSFLAIFIISISALIAHNKLSNVDVKMGLLLGLGGIAGAQIGARLVEYVSTANFKKIFAIVLMLMAFYLFFQKSWPEVI